MRWLVVLTALSFFLPTTAIPREKNKLIVAILDTGLDLNDPRFTRFLCPGRLHRDFTGEGIADRHYHGTHVAGLIIRDNDPEKFCLVIVKVFDGNGLQRTDSYQHGLYYLRTLHADVVNMSLSGDFFIEQEGLLFKENPRARFVVAAGNDGADLRKVNCYPAILSRQYANVIPVGGLDSRGYRMPLSNFGLPKMKWFRGKDVLSTIPGGLDGYMSGTSQATGTATSKLIRGYDRATDSFLRLSTLEESI